MKQQRRKKLNSAACLLLLMTGAMLSGCGKAGEDQLVVPEMPVYNAVVPRTVEVIRGDLTPQYSNRLDLLGYDRSRYQFTQAEYEEMYGTYQLTLDEIRVDVGDHVKKGDVLVSFHSDVLDKQKKEKEDSIENSKLQIDHLKRLTNIDPSQDHREEISRLNREIEIARLYIRDIEETYDKLNITAEVDGFVSFVNTSLRDGYILPGKDLVVVDYDKGLYTVAKTEDYDFKAGEEFTAHLGGKERRVRVVDTPEGEAGNLVYFEPVDSEGEMLEKNLMLEFDLPVMKDICYVNRQAVYENEDLRFVYVVREDGMRTEVDVELGDRVGNYYIVKKGLKGGELLELP